MFKHEDYQDSEAVVKLIGEDPEPFSQRTRMGQLWTMEAKDIFSLMDYTMKQTTKFLNFDSQPISMIKKEDFVNNVPL